MLPSRREIAAFCLRFAAILAIYLIPWGAIGDAYAGAAVAIADATVAGDSGALRLDFARANVSDGAGIDARFGVDLRATDTASGATVRLALDLRSLTYLPTAVFVALAAAAPIWQGRRGLRVLLVGLGILHVFFAASLALTVILFLAQPVPLHAVHLAPATTLVLDVLHRAFVSPPGMAIAVPGFVWVALVWLTLEPRCGPANRQAAPATAWPRNSARG
jgi:hypothetical protein